MRTQSLILAALIGASHAIKQTTVAQREGNMGQTLTTEGFMIESLDDVQTEIEEWYSNTTKPFIKEHRNLVYKAAFAEMEEKHGALLETCDEGTACREAIIAEMKTVTKQIWQRVLKELETEIENSVRSTRSAAEEAWEKLVTCGEEANCCHYTEVTINNLWIQVTHYREAIVSETTKWYDFEERRKEMVEECPDVVFHCDNVCADGTARDDSCDCPSFDSIAHPACPTSLCADGSVRDAEHCDCPNELAEVPVIDYAPEVPEIHYEPVEEAVESHQVKEVGFETPDILAAPQESDSDLEVTPLNAPTEVTLERCEENLTIKWDIPAHNGHLLLGYEIMIGGHLVTNCKEHLEVQITNAECTIEWPSLKQEPFFLPEGQEIKAKVRSEYLNEGTSDWSPVGSGATIPITSSYEEASSWVIEQPMGYTQVPNVPSYTQPLTGIQEWAYSRFDFQFGCEMSNSVRQTQDLAPEGQVEELAEFVELPADGIRRIVVSHNDKESQNYVVRGIWMYDAADELLFEFNKYKTDAKDGISQLEFNLNEGERIIGIRGDTSNEFLKDGETEGYYGYWKDLEFLVSDGSVDRSLTVNNVAPY